MIECLTQISYFGFNRISPNLVEALMFIIQKILSNCLHIFSLQSIIRLISKTSRKFSRPVKELRNKFNLKFYFYSYQSNISLSEYNHTYFPFFILPLKITFINTICCSEYILQWLLFHYSGPTAIVLSNKEEKVGSSKINLNVESNKWRP